MKTRNRLLAMFMACFLAIGLFPAQANAARPKLTIAALPQTYLYNGQLQGEGGTIYADPAQIAQKVWVQGLDDGHYISVVMLIGDGTNAGKYEITVNPFTLVVSNIYGTDVTADYDLGLLEGTLTIEPAPLTITTASASKVYDGTPLTADGASIEGLVGNQTATVTATGSQTDVGTSKNTYSIDWGITEKSNYRIVENLGTLTVTAPPPQTGDDSHPALWSGLALLALAGLTAAALTKKRRGIT